MRPEQRGAGLCGTVALITGGGRGIGRLLAQALAGAGASVGLIARSDHELTESVRLITQAGGHAEAAAADASNAAAIQRAISDLHDRLGPVSLLVNNAGIAGPAGNAWDVPADAWWQTIEVNLGGTFLCTRLVLSGMTARGAGRIINVTSNAGVLRWPQVSAYAVSKAAIIKLTENLATETRRNGVGIFSVDPGMLPIGLGAAAVACTATPGSAEARRDAWIRQQLAAGNGAEPASVTRLIMRIAAGHADELSGCHLSVHDDLDMMLAQARHLPQRDMYRLRRYQPADTTDPASGRPGHQCLASRSRDTPSLKSDPRSLEGRVLAAIRGLAEARRSQLALRSGGITEILPTGNRSVLAYRRAHPRSAPFLSLTNFSDIIQAPDAGIIARAGLYDPAHVHFTTGQLTVNSGRIELPPWGFVWLTGT